MDSKYDRIVPPRGLLAGSGVLLAVTWGLYAASPTAWPGLTGAFVQTGVYAGNLVVTTRRPRLKIAVVRGLQRFALNPLVRAMLAVGLNPLGLVLLETRGRTSGRPRRVPVGNGRMPDGFWIIAEHGERAGYVRNIVADPRVRVRVRVGLRRRWLDGTAELLVDDDPLARQRRICRRHPLRAPNAANVRVLGADLLTIRVRLGDEPRPCADDPVAGPTASLVGAR